MLHAVSAELLAILQEEDAFVEVWVALLSLRNVLHIIAH